MKRLICTALFILLLSGCALQNASRTVFHMNTVMDLTLWGGGEAVLDDLEELLSSLEKTWSVTDPNSPLSRFNRGDDTALSQVDRLLLDQVTALSERTGGAFNPNLYALSRCWGFYDETYRVPTVQERAAALLEKKWDLGGVLKGYAGQQCTQLLSHKHVQRAILSLGGNVQTFGEKPNGEPWQIGIQNPRGGDPLGILQVQGTMAVITSGDYQRYFEEDGIRYHHILDAETGAPAHSGLSSVTVVCRDGMTADALSTALFVMGLEAGTQFWRESQDFEAVFVTSGGKIYATQGITLTGCAFEVISR